MEINPLKIKTCILNNNEIEFTELLNNGLDPNLGGGWPIRLAARNGCHLIVKSLLQHGANPHLLSDAGASTLQLAVYSGESWCEGKWNFLLSYCDSSQLADGAAVAIIFQNILALKNILATQRCNTNIPTTLTGKTVEELAKGYKLHHFLTSSDVQSQNNTTPPQSPRCSRQTLLIGVARLKMLIPNFAMLLTIGTMRNIIDIRLRWSA
ncbi:unnamed protein product [Diatraea saccharalis]|uniref:Uncharacterized protein n=1 Tax=Diatraea saccharalis TaxID=40085 RepID=A0A9N9QW80_9NEOP|nr:unnamed protein product [Diatraea saccharalis]